MELPAQFSAVYDWHVCKRHGIMTKIFCVGTGKRTDTSLVKRRFRKSPLRKSAAGA